VKYIIQHNHVTEKTDDNRTFFWLFSELRLDYDDVTFDLFMTRQSYMRTKKWMIKNRPELLL
jgi:hypothetical protein